MLQETLNSDCRMHLYKAEDGRLRSNHLLRDCREFDRLADTFVALRRAAVAATPAPPQQPSGAPAIMPPPAQPTQPSAGSNMAGAIQTVPRVEEPQYPAPQGQMYMIQPGKPSKREEKLRTRQVNLAAMAPPAIPEFLRGAETEINFSKKDHPPSVTRPGHAALVLDAQIGKYAMSKVFMDGGSGINIIFADTLRKMNRSVENLPKSSNTFHGIVPGKAISPEGTILLEVTFGDKSHFRTETLEFEVVDWKSQYHAILGRPAFARFMAVPHYAYLQLKMPGPKGVITVKGNFQKSDSCDREFSKISETFGVEARMAELAVSNDRTLLPEHKKQAPDRSFSTSHDTREHQVHPTDPSKTGKVSTSLDPA